MKTYLRRKRDELGEGGAQRSAARPMASAATPNGERSDGGAAVADVNEKRRLAEPAAAAKAERAASDHGRGTGQCWTQRQRTPLSSIEMSGAGSGAAFKRGGGNAELSDN